MNAKMDLWAYAGRVCVCVCVCVSVCCAQEIASVTYQSLFRLFPRLAGMTGTAFTDAKVLTHLASHRDTPAPYAYCRRVVCRSSLTSTV